MSFTTTTSAQTGLAGSMLALKAALKASAYTVTRSSDGISFSSSGDIITTAGTGAGGINNSGAWFVVAVAAGSPDTQQYLFYRGGSGEWAIWQSASAGFTGGSPTGLPTAADGVETLQSGVAFIFPDAVWYPPPVSFTLTIGVEDASPWRWYVQTDTPNMGTAAVGAPGAPLVLATGTQFGTVVSWFPDDGAAATAIIAMMTFLGTGGGGGGGGDTTPPAIDDFSPSDGSSIARADSVSVKVTDDTALGLVTLSVALADGTVVAAYDGSNFLGPFAAGSNLTGDTYTLEYDAPGWPSSAIDLLVTAIDTAGNVATSTVGYTISDAPAAPTVGPFSPTDGGNTTRTGTVTIDVTDDEGRTAIALVTISATLSDGTVVTIYNGAAFVGALATGSARSNITDGYRYSIVHDSPGWESSTLAYRVTAVDSGGLTTTHTTYNLNITDAPAAPTISSFSPSAGSIARADNVDFTVTSSDGFSKIVVWAVLGDGSSVVVYTGSAFGAQVDGASTVSGTTTRSFSITYDGDGWTDDYTLHVSATSALGLTATASSAYTLTDAPEPVVPDATAPTVALVSPTDGAEIARTAPVVVDVTDEGGLATVFLWASYPDGEEEVVYRDGTFANRFRTSTRSGITNGGRYTLRRSGGWRAAPTIHVGPVDTSGNTP